MTGPVVPSVANFTDIKGREVVALVPILVLTIFLGFYPKPVLNVVNPAVEKTMAWVGASDPTPAMSPAEGGESK